MKIELFPRDYYENYIILILEKDLKSGDKEMREIDNQNDINRNMMIYYKE